IVPEKLAQMGATIHPQDGISDGPTVMTVAYRPSAMTAGQIISAVTEANLHILDLSTEETDLEDIFLQLTKHD
ncbi:MAG TPA: multidrug ABC transporter ATP-binding protein, partial [Rhodospirillaceae bacterium]|nr:multidrug ABC transporter ATP-binding protein [Rhodospirillaceae bacterium]